MFHLPNIVSSFIELDDVKDAENYRVDSTVKLFINLKRVRSNRPIKYVRKVRLGILFAFKVVVKHKLA